DPEDVTELQRDRASARRNVAGRCGQCAGLLPPPRVLDDDVVAGGHDVVDRDTSVGEAVRPHLREAPCALRPAEAGASADGKAIARFTAVATKGTHDESTHNTLEQV